MAFALNSLVIKPVYIFGAHDAAEGTAHVRSDRPVCCVARVAQDHRAAMSSIAFESAAWILDLVDTAGVPYEGRMRHYTEGIDETLIFFLPTDEPH
jgi:hypothetical protein